MDPRVAAEVVVLCCAIKPLCGWNAEECATTSRERCGGQGYLSVNRFGSLMGFAHAGMTAEGDNRVLMQKVAKELLPMLAWPAVQARHAAADALTAPVQIYDAPSLQSLRLLLGAREARCLKQLAGVMKQAGPQFFDHWMKQQSDLVQASALAFAEAMVLEASVAAVQEARLPAQDKTVLQQVGLEFEFELHELK